MTIQDIVNHLAVFAPLETAFPSDNVGLLVGDAHAEVTGILTALDCTVDVVRLAAECGANLIVTHHPVIYRPLSAVLAGTYDGDRVIALNRAGVSVISMHTNMDRAEGGVNTAMAEALGLTNVALLPDGEGLGRMGELSLPMAEEAFLGHVKACLQVECVRYAKTGKTIRKVAVGGGSCGGYVSAAKAAGCDALVVGEVKHAQFCEALHLGITLVDATHYASENVVMPVLTAYLREVYANVKLARTENPVSFA